MKYYYKGQLVRTSNNDYTWALITQRNDSSYKAIKCSKNYEACLRELNYLTKGESIAEQKGITIKEAYISGRYGLASSQCHRKEDYIIAKLERE